MPSGTNCEPESLATTVTTGAAAGARGSALRPAAAAGPAPAHKRAPSATARLAVGISMRSVMSRFPSSLFRQHGGRDAEAHDVHAAAIVGVGLVADRLLVRTGIEQAAQRERQ